MTLEEEDKLLKYYAGKIQSICQALQLPDKVRATALTYLKRAYLSFSVLDHNPKDTMLACIYLAGKVRYTFTFFKCITFLAMALLLKAPSKIEEVQLYMQCQVVTSECLSAHVQKTAMQET